ncbi:MAG TPA: hypothetical protein VGG72_15270 [Bryobacteraceae bacterium]|jgi:hypothetical protein
MTNFMKAILCSAAAFALVVSLSAQDKGKAGAKSGILQPQMTVGADGGTYAKPLGTLGEKPAQPWSPTTLGASVDGKPNAGAVKTVVGEIVDFSCYLEVGKHGEKHRDCAQKCFRNGQPIGLLTQDGSLYMLMEEEHDPRRDGMTDFRQAAIDHAGQIMQVTGTSSSVNGFTALYVHGYLKKG